ncbi:hypothetical protein Tco_0875400 [Tanacetum coccineum]|uniref:Synaptobrevin, longin-like domain protein n=1 Tax=Tanacetum coccineum TaxID=301880 RepID=A0ABQ5BUA1_9ASTR
MRDIVRSKIEREHVGVKIHDGNAFWNKIGVNASISKLMLLSLNLLLLVLVYAARHSLTAVRHKLMLLVITSYCWAIAKAKTVNGDRHIQALVDKKKVIITEKSVRSDLMLEDAEGTECLPNNVIFEQLTLMGTMTSAIICLATNKKINFSKYIFDNMMKNLEGRVKFLMYPRFVQVFLDKQLEGMSKRKGIYVTPSHTKNIFANMKRKGKGFSGRITTLFQIMMVQAPDDMGEDSAALTDSHSTPIITQLSSSKPQKKKSRRKHRKDSGPIEPIPDEATNEEHVSTPFYDPPQSGEDRLQLIELMSLCTSLQEKVIDLEKAKTAQAKEIASLKKRVKQLEKRKKSRTSGLKRLRKVGSASRVESSNDVSLGAQEDASKQGRKIANLDVDTEVTLIDETQERNDEDLMFNTDVLNGDEVFKEPIVNAAKTTSPILVSATDPVTTADPVTIAGEVVTTAIATTTVDELTLAQTLIEIKSAKPKAITTATTTITTAVASTRPKAKGIVFHEQEEQSPKFTPIVSSSQAPQLSQEKDKGKAKMVDPEKPSNKKDQIALDEELALRLHAEEQAKLERMQKEKVAQEEASRAAVIEELDSIQAMVEADDQLAARLQADEQEQFSMGEKSRMLVEMIAERKKFFAAQRAVEQRSKPPTKTQIRNRMCAYVKNMDVMKSSVTRTEGSSKRAGDELESDKSKKQKIDEHVEAKKDDDQKEAEIKMHIEIVKDDEVAIDAIPLATKPLMIVEYKIVKEGKFGYF